MNQSHQRLAKRRYMESLKVERVIFEVQTQTVTEQTSVLHRSLI